MIETSGVVSLTKEELLKSAASSSSFFSSSTSCLDVLALLSLSKFKWFLTPVLES